MKVKQLEFWRLAAVGWRSNRLLGFDHRVWPNGIAVSNRPTESDQFVSAVTCFSWQPTQKGRKPSKPSLGLASRLAEKTYRLLAVCRGDFVKSPIIRPLHEP